MQVSHSVHCNDLEIAVHAHARPAYPPHSLSKWLECITALRGSSNTGSNLKPHGHTSGFQPTRWRRNLIRSQARHVAHGLYGRPTRSQCSMGSLTGAAQAACACGNKQRAGKPCQVGCVRTQKLHQLLMIGYKHGSVPITCLCVERSSHVCCTAGQLQLEQKGREEQIRNVSGACSHCRYIVCLCHALSILNSDLVS